VKVFNLGLELESGKYVYKSSCFEKIVAKFSPKESTPYKLEFIDKDPETAEAVVFKKDKRLDLIVADLEIIETRLKSCQSDEDKALFENCQQALEKEKLLSEVDFSDQERLKLKTLPLISFKPCLGRVEVGDRNSLIGELLKISGLILFFTVNKKEVRAFSLKKGLAVIEAAGKIHSDLQRGFIKAEIANCRDLDSFFNMAEAKSRGFVKLVDRDYIVEDGDIIQIRFNV